MDVTKEDLENDPSKVAAAAHELNALIGATKNDIADHPVIPPPPGDVIHLPGGIARGGTVIRDVYVRELTGSDEEILSKIAVNGILTPSSVNRFLNALMECGVDHVGDLTKAESRSLLKDILVGDRDAILMGVREATYGPEIELPHWQCPQCGGKTELKINLSQIPVDKLKNPAKESQFEVTLRRGAIAKVRLETVRVTEDVWADDELTTAQRDSILLSKSISEIVQPDGTRQVMAGFARSIVLNLSIPDRKAILRELVKRQPGPQYNGVKFVHDDCGKEVTLSLGLGDLFPDFA